MKEIKEKIRTLLTEMNKGAYEREELISLAMLSALSGESIFLLGLPGVGKSMVARRLKMAFKDAQSFEYLMSRFSIPDEIFGPVSICKLKDGDTYERVIDGYLPTADVVFLDEIWKAGPAIQNSLLTVLNEKIFRNGKQDIQLPLKAVIAASNELPAEGEGLEAMWDRFLIRYVVKPIVDKHKFISLITEEPEPCVIPENLKITTEEFYGIQEASHKVDIPWEIGELIFTIRKVLKEEKENLYESVDVTKTDLIEPPYVSDRRWKKVIGVMRTSAYLNGRDCVDISDCILLIHMLWDNSEQIQSMKKLIGQAIVNNMKRYGVDMMSQIEGKRFTKPMGELISPDGMHYVFVVDKEELLISKDEYQKLADGKIHYGQITSDNKMLVGDKPTSLKVRMTADGLAVNSFSYPLKRNSNLRTGSVKSMLESVTSEVDKQEKALTDMVNDNLFLLDYHKYAFLGKAFVDSKDNFIRKGY